MWMSRDGPESLRADGKHRCTFIFFFQAEEGIRDDLVTGFQTCALPIFPEMLIAAHRLGSGLGDERPEDDQRALHGAGRDQHLGDEEVAFLEPPPDLLEGGDQRFERSEERRVGKECRARWSPEYYKKTRE